MKRMIHLVFVAALVSGAGLAGTQAPGSLVAEAPQENQEVYLNVAAMGQASERHAAPEAQPIRRVESMMEGPGLGRYGGFLPRSGPNDDGPF